MDGSANDTWSERPPLLRPAVRLEPSGKYIFLIFVANVVLGLSSSCPRASESGTLTRKGVGVYRMGPDGIGSVVYQERYLLLILSFLQSWQCKVWKL